MKKIFITLALFVFIAIICVVYECVFITKDDKDNSLEAQMLSTKQITYVLSGGQIITQTSTPDQCGVTAYNWQGQPIGGFAMNCNDVAAWQAQQEAQNEQMKKWYAKNCPKGWTCTQNQPEGGGGGGAGGGQGFFIENNNGGLGGEESAH